MGSGLFETRLLFPFLEQPNASVYLRPPSRPVRFVRLGVRFVRLGVSTRTEERHRSSQRPQAGPQSTRLARVRSLAALPGFAHRTRRPTPPGPAMQRGVGGSQRPRSRLRADNVDQRAPSRGTDRQPSAVPLELRDSSTRRHRGIPSRGSSGIPSCWQVLPQRPLVRVGIARHLAGARTGLANSRSSVGTANIAAERVLRDQP